jgi:hypothetical protein
MIARTRYISLCFLPHFDETPFPNADASCVPVKKLDYDRQNAIANQKFRPFASQPSAVVLLNEVLQQAR